MYICADKQIFPRIFMPVCGIQTDICRKNANTASFGISPQKTQRRVKEIERLNIYKKEVIMWLVFAFVSATIVGIRDFFKKRALQNNSILMVLCMVTVFSALWFVPFILASRFTHCLDDSFFYVPAGNIQLHLCSMVKCVLLIGCWLCSFYGIKHLPLTVSGIVAAFGPVETVVAAIFIYGESLNILQWTGVLVSTASLIAVCWNGRSESSDFVCGRHFWIMLLSTLFSTASALWDKHAVGRPEDGGLGLSVMFIQCWYNIYQSMFLTVALLLASVRRTTGWRGSLPMGVLCGICMVSLCEVVADLLYDAALQLPGCMVSIMAMVRRGSVIVSFALGAFILRERNLGRKLLDLILVLAGMFLIFLGSK